MAGHDGQDPDRAAILARRRQFIAVALGGLAMGCGPNKPTPKPNTTGESGTQSETTGEESDSDTETSGSELKLDQPPDSWTDTETDGGGETGPRPCLTPPG